VFTIKTRGAFLAFALLQQQLCFAAPLAFHDFLRAVRAAKYQDYAGTVTKKDFAEMKAYIATYYKGVRVERSFLSEETVTDCVVTSTQPSLRNRFVAAACAEGTIPLRRLTLPDLIRAKTLKRFLEKSPGEGAPPVPPPQ
jgi:hypothetical protein